MNPFNDIKSAILVDPQIVDDDPAVTGYVDTMGFREAIIDVLLAPAVAANPLLTLTFAQGDAAPTVEVPHVAFLTGKTPAAYAGAAGTFELPDPGDPEDAEVSTQQTIRLRVKVAGRRKRYLSVSATSTANRGVCVVATLVKSGVSLPAAADQGATILLEA